MKIIACSGFLGELATENDALFTSKKTVNIEHYLLRMRQVDDGIIDGFTNKIRDERWKRS